WDALGGGAHQCTLNNCILMNNSAESANSHGPPMGGGAYQCTLNNCTLSGNYTWPGMGGGAADCTLNNCILLGNGYHGDWGGGAFGSVLNNCTLSANSGSSGGGAAYSTLNNCIVLDGASSSILNFCWTSDPLFAPGSLRLQSNSPCINAGSNSYVTNATD